MAASNRLAWASRSTDADSLACAQPAATCKPPRSTPATATRAIAGIAARTRSGVGPAANNASSTPRVANRPNAVNAPEATCAAQATTVSTWDACQARRNACPTSAGSRRSMWTNDVCPRSASCAIHCGTANSGSSEDSSGFADSGDLAPYGPGFGPTVPVWSFTARFPPTRSANLPSRPVRSDGRLCPAHPGPVEYPTGWTLRPSPAPRCGLACCPSEQPRPSVWCRKLFRRVLFWRGLEDRGIKSRSERDGPCIPT